MQYGLYFDVDSKNKSIYVVDANEDERHEELAYQTLNNILLLSESINEKLNIPMKHHELTFDFKYCTVCIPDNITSRLCRDIGLSIPHVIYFIYKVKDVK